MLSRTAAIAIASFMVFGCTATRTREFAREAYRAPAALAAPSRVFTAQHAAVDGALREVLERRGARLAEENDRALVYQIPWSNSDEARASVDLGTFHRTTTVSQRAYRSWSPLHFRCDECVIEHGSLTGETTRVVGDNDVVMDADRYRLEAWLTARTESLRSGTRVVFEVRIDVDPLDPPDLAPVSNGLLEARLFEALEAVLLR